MENFSRKKSQVWIKEEINIIKEKNNVEKEKKTKAPERGGRLKQNNRQMKNWCIALKQMYSVVFFLIGCWLCISRVAKPN